MFAIEFQHLTLSLVEKTIIRDFSAGIKSGEFIGIFGANGAGKTTLLKMILGLIKPTNGSIYVLNQQPTQGNPAIGYLPQFHQMIQTNYLSGRERIAATLNGYRWGLPYLNKQQKKQVDKVIHLVGAEEYANRPFAVLSGGERQRLGLAQALLNQPQILLLDEPLSGLDPGQQEKMLSLISTLQQEFNITVLLTAHDLNPLLNIMQRLIYLASGKAMIGTVNEVVTSKNLSELYSAPIEVISHQNRLFVIHSQSGRNIHDIDHAHH